MMTPMQCVWHIIKQNIPTWEQNIPKYGKIFQPDSRLEEMSPGGKTRFSRSAPEAASFKTEIIEDWQQARERKLPFSLYNNKKVTSNFQKLKFEWFPWKANPATSQSLCRAILEAFAEEAIADHFRMLLLVDLEFQSGERNWGCKIFSPKISTTLENLPRPYQQSMDACMVAIFSENSNLYFKES